MTSTYPTKNFINNTPTPEDEFNIPLCIEDIISICREYNKLGWQLQQQIENIVELGVEEAINSGEVQQAALPYIKNFLVAITLNPYFGDAADQSKCCIALINQYQETNKIVSALN